MNKSQAKAIRVVYQDDLMCIYLPTSVEYPLPPFVSGIANYIYNFGRFCQVSKNGSVTHCSPAQNAHLLSIMTRFGDLS